MNIKWFSFLISFLKLTVLFHLRVAVFNCYFAGKWILDFINGFFDGILIVFYIIFFLFFWFFFLSPPIKVSVFNLDGNFIIVVVLLYVFSVDLFSKQKLLNSLEGSPNLDDLSYCSRQALERMIEEIKDHHGCESYLWCYLPPCQNKRKEASWL